MTTYNANQIAACIYFVGGFGPGSASAPADAAKGAAWLDTAIAIVLAESGGNVEAKNGNAEGLWQIMTSVHAELVTKYRAQYATQDPTSPEVSLVPNAFDPRVNTSIARDLYNAAGGWKDWEVYNTGAYKAHLGHGKKAFQFISNPANLQAYKTQYEKDMPKWSTKGMSKTVTDTSWKDILAGFPDYLVKRIKEMGITVGIFLLGAIILILGAWFLLSRNAGNIARYTPQGTIAKAAKDVIK